MDFTNDPLNDEIRGTFLGKCQYSKEPGGYCPFVANILSLKIKKEARRLNS